MNTCVVRPFGTAHAKAWAPPARIDLAFATLVQWQ